MSDASSLLLNETRPVDDAVREGEADDDSRVKNPERNDEEGPTTVLLPDPEEDKELMIVKKYSGLLPRKPPLISQDHERAFFDSADWALAKQGPHRQPRGLLEPKLQPSPQQQVRSRRSAYAPQSPSGESSQSQDNTGSGRSSAAESTESCESRDDSGEVLAPEKEIFQDGSLGG